jgi:hypothetical protein
LRISQQAGRTRDYADLQVDDARLCKTDLLLRKGIDENVEQTLEASNKEDTQPGEHKPR